MTKEQLNRGVNFLTKRSDFGEFVDNHEYAIRNGMRGMLTGGIMGGLAARETKQPYGKNIARGVGLGGLLGGSLGAGLDVLNRPDEPPTPYEGNVFNQEPSQEDEFLKGLQRQGDEYYANGIAKRRMYSSKDLEDPGIKAMYEAWKNK